MRRAVRILILALLVLAVVANGALAAGIVLTREPAPKPLTPERVATASKPAIVFVQSNYTISTSMPQPTQNSAALVAALQPRVDDGEITNQAQYDHAWWQLEMNNPDSYYTPGAITTDKWDDWVTGSAFFVTEDGYLVTAAHVVTASKAEERAGIVAYTKTTPWVTETRANIKKGWSDYGPSDAEVDTYLNFWQRWIAKYMTVDKIDSAYHIANGPSVRAGDELSSHGIAVSVVSLDPTVGGHDIAVLKAPVDGVPALALAAAEPQMGDATYAIGYPRTSFQDFRATANNFPVVVTVGKIQRMHSQTGPDGDFKVYGTDAQLEHGDSGGPVVDAKGNVMGVMSFIVPDANGKQLPGQGYFVPSSFVQQDLAKAGVTIAPDPRKTNLTNTYYRALAKGDEARYKEELNLLLSIQERSIMNPYVAGDIAHARIAIGAAQDTTPPDLTRYAWPAAASAAGVILVAMLSWLVVGLMLRGPRRLPSPPEEEQPPTEEQPPPVVVGAVPAD